MSRPTRRAATAVHPSDEALVRAGTRGFLQILGGRTTALALQFIAFGLLASYLGPELLGVYTLALGLVVIFRVIPTFGFDPIVTREITQHPEREAELVPSIAILRALLGAVSYGLLVLTLLLGGYDSRSTESALIAGAVLLLLWTETFRGSLNARLRFGWVAFADMLEAVVTLIGIAALVAHSASVNAFLWLYVAAKVLNSTLIVVAATRVAPPSRRPGYALWRPMLLAAAPVGLAGILITLYTTSGIVLLARLKDAAEVGQFGAALRFFDVFMLLPTLALTVVQPIFARSFNEPHEVLQRRFGRMLRFMVILAVPVSITGAMTAARALPLLPGFDEYASAGIALAILAPAAGLSFVAAIVQAALLAGHQQRSLLVTSFAGFSVNLLLLVLLVPAYGAYGAAAAMTPTELVVVTMSLAYAARRLGLIVSWNTLLRLVPASLVLAAVLALGFALHPLLQLGLGLLAYILALLLTRAVSLGELVGAFHAGSSDVQVVDPENGDDPAFPTLSR
jgi:O-antigen/teichoic acid export membrane protein